MDLKLKGIGIINDSEIKLDGLTVITGRNNSGKTTVGKALYSLLDAVCNIPEKANIDKLNYILKNINKVRSKLEIIGGLGSISDDVENDFLNGFPTIKKIVTGKFKPLKSVEKYERFSEELISELKRFDTLSFIKNISEEKDFPDFLSDSENRKRFVIVLQFNIEQSIKILTQMLDGLNQNSNLDNYTKENIYQTLKIEFSDQIQPVANSDIISEIKIKEDDLEWFDLKIANNTILDDGSPIFTTSKYNKVLFIDDPFILDDTPHKKNNVNAVEAENNTLLDTARLLSHDNKLKKILRSQKEKTVLEHTLKNESLEKLMSNISAVLPGSFLFDKDGEFYINKGIKLKISNLATGSKLFSIIKILLEQGNLDENTMLILDEPEAHLHPEWQNKFAEFIVLLVKELGVNIVLTSHSPNFVLALDAYMRKYNIENKTNFYQTRINEDSSVDYDCVNDNIESIYDDFLKFLSEAKAIRDKYVYSSADSEE